MLTVTREFCIWIVRIVSWHLPEFLVALFTTCACGKNINIWEEKHAGNIILQIKRGGVFLYLAYLFPVEEEELVHPSGT